MRRLQGFEVEDSSSDSDVHHDEEQLAEEILADRSMFTRFIETGCGAELSNLPLKYLAPGTVTHLYHDCCSSLGPNKMSYSTFLRSWKLFSDVLRFRGKSDFADCDTCCDLKKQVKESKQDRVGYGSLLEATKKLQDHYREVGLSRDLEEALRSMPPTSPKPVLVICTDGMDQSHWALPRLRGFRGPKRFSNPSVRRPKCKVQGVWCFFFGVHFFIADATQPHDSNLTCEVISRALEHCKQVAEKRSLPLPSDMAIFCDNTPRENKNTCLLTFMALLQCRHMFRSTGLLFHCKGHTHNILDQLYGIVSRTFQFQDYLPDLDSVRESIKEILNRPSLAKYFSGAEVNVTIIEGCRNWASWLDELGVNFLGGLRDDCTANHAFVFMWRILDLIVFLMTVLEHVFAIHIHRETKACLLCGSVMIF